MDLIYQPTRIRIARQMNFLAMQCTQQIKLDALVVSTNFRRVNVHTLINVWQLCREVSCNVPTNVTIENIYF